MSTEKRKVSTDALETLGSLIDETAGRDAIHLAVEPVVAMETLYPGQHVGLVGGMASPSAPKKLGIVDPFITGGVQAGERFWLIVYPRQITSLRHVWEHPEFPTKEETAVAKLVQDKLTGMDIHKRYIEDFADSVGLAYDRIMEAADAYVEDGSTMSLGPNEESVPHEFWHHYEKLTGKHPKYEGSFFSCSC